MTVMSPVITVTPAARAKIDGVRAKSGHPDACLRIAIAGRRGGEFVYELDLVAPADAPPGDVVVDTPDLRVLVQLGGGCQGCAQVDVTLRQGIEVAIKAAVPQITEVIDITDHAAGMNPYFQPAKKAS